MLFLNIKNLAKTLTIDEFNKRFTKDSNGYLDNSTGAIIFCPSDLGSKINQADCLESGSCKKCWNEVKDCLRFRGRI